MTTYHIAQWEVTSPRKATTLCGIILDHLYTDTYYWKIGSEFVAKKASEKVNCTSCILLGWAETPPKK